MVAKRKSAGNIQRGMYCERVLGGELKRRRHTHVALVSLEVSLVRRGCVPLVISVSMYGEFHKSMPLRKLVYQPPPDPRGWTIYNPA